VVNQAALAKSKEEAERANKAKSEFLSRMSHELRTPLNAILGFSQMMKREPDMDTEERTSSVDLIYNAGNHLLGLVDEVLDLSKIETGKYSITTENLNASLKIKDLISQIQLLAKEKDITILNRLSEQDDLYVKADNKAFNQIILNILNNAVQYNNQAGSITVDGGIFGNDKIWLSVTDTGLGIAKENTKNSLNLLIG
jgi:signal transduction histidine kinase